MCVAYRIDSEHSENAATTSVGPNLQLVQGTTETKRKTGAIRAPYQLSLLFEIVKPIVERAVVFCLICLTVAGVGYLVATQLFHVVPGSTNSTSEEASVKGMYSRARYFTPRAFTYSPDKPGGHGPGYRYQLN